MIDDVTVVSAGCEQYEHYKNNKDLLAHKRQKHHSMSCVICGLSFTRCDNLKRHIRTHQDREDENSKQQTKQQTKQFEQCEQCDV